MKMISVAFVDDHPILLSGISQLFSAGKEFNVVGVGHNAQDLIDIAVSLLPDVIIMDLNMPGKVLEAAAKISNMNTKTKLVAFTVSADIDTVVASLEAGVLGYVLKGSTLEELADAIRQVHDGETYMTPRLAAKVVAGLKRPARQQSIPRIIFTKREEDVLCLLLKGATNRLIAEELLLSEKTIKHYMSLLIAKMEVQNRVQVVLAAQTLVKTGALSPSRRLN